MLLAVGVIALILAAGYLLRLSFDRGWISPLMRCIGGALSGIAVGAIGWRLQPRYRTYGAALVGCGAAIIYLSVWAAARLYGVLPPTTGLVGLALVSVALAMIAYAINVEALGTTAALGAFFAPILLGRDQGNPELLLLYLASMAAGLGLVAARRRWRLTMFVVASSYFGVAYTGAADRGPAVGTPALRRRRWDHRDPCRAPGALVGNPVPLLRRRLGVPGRREQRLPQRWAILAGGFCSAPVWWYALRATQILPLRLSTRRGCSRLVDGRGILFFPHPVPSRLGAAPSRPGLV